MHYFKIQFKRSDVKRKILPLLLAVTLLTGCSTGLSVENLLSAPKLDAQQNEIYQALINSTGSAVKLKYPKGGEYRSAVVVRNIDDEPTDEALVFYEQASVQSGDAALRLKVLDQYDGAWQVMYDLACIGSEVDSISFTTLGVGNRTDIIVRFSMLNQTEQTFSVINYTDGVAKELYTASYSCLEVIDLNGDGFNELITVSTDKTAGVSTAMMFGRTETGFEKLSEAALTGSHSEIISTTKGLISENVSALFLDCSRGHGQYGTDVIYCQGNTLISPDSIGSEPESSIISRFTNDYMSDIFCTDIDSDGFIEIPSTAPLPGYETLTRPEQLCAVQWYTISDNSFALKYYGYFSSKFRFVLLFPNRWRGVVSAVPNLQDNEIIFIGYDAKTGLEVNDSTELMRIRIVDKNDGEKLKDSAGMTILGETEEAVYCYSVTNSYKTGSLALTESELENSFILLDK